ncbi:MAG: competence/damage-inducible protein A [Bacteroidota bacterium]|nr:MAG: competence/damage-inducible protein A [Bacteroidota bacterium]
MQATLITIGDEILIGQVVDTNSAFMAAELNKIGIRVKSIHSISDKHSEILQAFSDALSNSEIVLITGGLGPTRDDITKKALADFFKCKLIRHQPSLEKIEKRLTQLGVKLSEINRTQADVPEVCKVLPNNQGSAPGMLFEKEGKVMVSMPGVPFEMKDIMLNEVIPYLQKHFTLPLRLHKTFLTAGVPESTLADRLTSFENMLPEGFSLAYLPSPGIVRLRLSATRTDETDLKLLFENTCLSLEKELGADLFGYDEDTLEAVLGRLLVKYGYNISTAESCTGGNVAKAISSVPGASAYFEGSIVAYSNQVKTGILKVPQEVIDQEGVVSEAVVKVMALRVKDLLQTDCSIAVSGISGPSGGTKEKPVGTVCIAIATPRGVESFKFNFGDNRERTVQRATITAINKLRMDLLSM